jgi:hypothetical protein
LSQTVFIELFLSTFTVFAVAQRRIHGCPTVNLPLGNGVFLYFPTLVPDFLAQIRK